MAMLCTVCVHADQDVINRELVSGESVNALATRYSVSEASMRRHKGRHLPRALVAAQDAADVAQADDLLSRLQSLLAHAEGRLDAADELFEVAFGADDFRAAATALQAGSAATREVRSCIELLLEVEGELDRRPQVTIINNPEWVEIRSVILVALQAHPEARHAVVRALGRVDASAVA